MSFRVTGVASDEKCVWCNGSDGELETIEIPAPNQFPFEGRDPRVEEVSVHPADGSLALDRNLQEIGALAVDSECAASP